jgi:hypothetical protein
MALTLSEWSKLNESNVAYGDLTYEPHKPNPDAGISMHAVGGDEMIKVTKDGFYVRGKKIPQDDKEAETVYNAFKQWLAWASLQQQR